MHLYPAFLNRLKKRQRSFTKLSNIQTSCSCWWKVVDHPTQLFYVWIFVCMKYKSKKHSLALCYVDRWSNPTTRGTRPTCQIKTCLPFISFVSLPTPIWGYAVKNVVAKNCSCTKDSIFYWITIRRISIGFHSPHPTCVRNRSIGHS